MKTFMKNFYLILIAFLVLNSCSRKKASIMDAIVGMYLFQGITDMEMDEEDFNDNKVTIDCDNGEIELIFVNDNYASLVFNYCEKSIDELCNLNKDDSFIFNGELALSGSMENDGPPENMEGTIIISGSRGTFKCEVSIEPKEESEENELDATGFFCGYNLQDLWDIMHDFEGSYEDWSDETRSLYNEFCSSLED